MFCNFNLQVSSNFQTQFVEESASVSQHPEEHRPQEHHPEPQQEPQPQVSSNAFEQNFDQDQVHMEPIQNEPMEQRPAPIFESQPFHEVEQPQQPQE